MVTSRHKIHESLDKAGHLAEVLKALGHPLRLRIVSLLSLGEAHVGALAQKLEAPQPIVSQQLRILRMSGLVEATRGNGHATYRLAEPQLLTMLACMDKCAAATRTVSSAPGGRRGSR